MMTQIWVWISFIICLFSLAETSISYNGEEIPKETEYAEESMIVGTWYMEDDEAAVLVFEEDGRVLYYDYDYDVTQIGSWSGSGESYALSFVWSDPFEMTFSGEDKLIGEDFILVKGEDVEVPFITYNTLFEESWYTDDEYELCFFDDGSWDITDYDGNTLIEGSENSVFIDEDVIVLISVTDEEFVLYVSPDGNEIYCSNNEMVFTKEILLDLPEEESEAEDNEYDLLGTWSWSEGENSGTLYFTEEWVEFGYTTADDMGAGSGFYTVTDDGVLLDELRIDEFEDSEFHFQDENTLVANNGVTLIREVEE